MEHRVAVIPGDGIGTEIMPEAIRILEAVGAAQGVSFSWQEFDWGCERYKESGRMAPDDFLEQLAPADAIFLGAVGAPGVPDHLSLWGLLIPIRRHFEQYVNLRPVRLLRGLHSPLADREPGSIDYVIVRENVEGEYSQIGGRLYSGSERETAVQESIFTRYGVDRIIRFAFELARSRPRKLLTSATKSNGIVHTMPFWDERFRAIATEYPDIETSEYHIDILSAHFVQHPERFDVVVASNLFGDILSDLGPATCGSIAIAPSANLNPQRSAPSMFEPVHGSAPDIAGQGIANPIGQIWSAALMLEHLGETKAADALMRAIESVIAEGRWLTPDLGGNASTRECGQAVIDAL